MNIHRRKLNCTLAAPKIQAFTRVEIVILLVVLGILVATVCPKIFSRVPHYGSFGGVATRSELSSIKTALDAFQVDTGHYPSGTNWMLDLVRNPTGMTNWHGPYLDQPLKDPWGQVYHYACPGKNNTNSYDLWSMGPPDGAPGDHMVITNWR